MHRFDIESLLRFTPPRFLCERCCALLVDVSVTVGGPAGGPTSHPPGLFRCPACGIDYVTTDDYPSPADYLTARGLDITFHDLIGHSQRLAAIARHTRESLTGARPFYPPMRALLEALATAERCVHFTTYGISALLLGAVKLAAQRVAVRGVVSGVKQSSLYQELVGFTDEAPRLELRTFTSDNGYFPHQKIIVIDGLLAFKGSANLTDFAWRKAAQGREVIEVVTDVAEVVELHNRFFSPIWASFTPHAENAQIVMTP